MSEPRPHFVYRIYDADERLIYVGCTANVKKRIGAHRRADGGNRASRWVSACMARYEVAGPYAGREIALQIEAQSINEEQPLFNTQRRATQYQACWMTRSAVAEYLIEHGHRALAEETCCECWSEYRAVGESDPSCVPHGHLALPDSETRAFDEPAA